MNQTKRYLANPIVSCGEEVDGAILYNPDLDITSVVNLTGLDIWSFLQTPHSAKEIVTHMIQNYRNVPVEQVEEDTRLFIKTLAPDFLLELDNET